MTGVIHAVRELLLELKIWASEACSTRTGASRGNDITADASMDLDQRSEQALEAGRKGEPSQRDVIDGFGTERDCKVSEDAWAKARR